MFARDEIRSAQLLIHGESKELQTSGRHYPGEVEQSFPALQEVLQYSEVGTCRWEGRFLGAVHDIFILHTQDTDWSMKDYVFLLWIATAAISSGHFLCRPISKYSAEMHLLCDCRHSFCCLCVTWKLHDHTNCFSLSSELCKQYAVTIKKKKNNSGLFLPR